MKRTIRALIVLVFTLSLVLSLVLSLASVAGATELKSAIGIVNARSGLRLRAKPNTDAAVLAVASEGDYVVIIRRSGDWYLVDYNLNIGYMSASYLTVKERENVELGDGAVNPTVANLRSGPSTDSARVCQLYAGDRVDIFGFNCGWYKVRFNGQVGYIRSDLVTLLEKPAANRGYAASGGSGSSGNSGSSGGSQSFYPAGVGQQLATYAQGFAGYPYVYGGTSPSGFDCSGFVQYVYGHFGYSIHRTATAQLQDGWYVSRDALQPGDIIYFGYGSTATHVGIYLGGGAFVHAANSNSGVIISNLSESWYANRYLTAHRVIG